MVPYCSCCLCLYFGSAIMLVIVSVPDHCLSFYFGLKILISVAITHLLQIIDSDSLLRRSIRHLRIISIVVLKMLRDELYFA